MNNDEKRDQSARSKPDTAQDRDDDFGGFCADHYGSMSAEGATRKDGEADGSN